MRVVEHREEFSGPMPHPEIMAGYERVLPGAADRILCMTEAQAQHRQLLESALMRGNITSQSRGQWMGFAIAAMALVGGIVLLALGRSIEGYSTMFGPLAGLAAIFLWTRRRQDAERAEKASGS